MTFALLATSAIAPSLLLVWFFHARDAFPEPPRVLWITFFLGMAIVAPVLLFAWPAYLLAQAIEAPLAHGFAAAFFGAAIPEEFFKLLVLRTYSMRHAAFDEPMDGIVYGATASLGFATLENVLYVSSEGGSVAFVRAFTAVPGHAFLGAIMGYYVGRARFAGPERRGGFLWKALAIPILLHGAYDFPLLAADVIETPDSPAAAPVLALLLLVPAVLCVEWIWTVRLVRRGRRDQLAGGPPPAAPATPTPPVVEPVAATVVAATSVEAAPAGVAAAPRPGRLTGWVLTLFGGLLASAGGLLILGVAVGILTGGVDAEEVGAVVLGTLVIGVLPAALGAGLFLWGVVRLNRA